MHVKVFVLSSYCLGLGEIVAAGETSALLTYGPLGVITAWMMWRDEKRSVQAREEESRNAKYHHDVLHRIDGLNRTMLAVELERINISPALEKYARQTIDKIDARSQEK